MQMGPPGDISMTRVGPKKLQINAQIMADAIMAKSLYIDGASLEEVVKRILAKVMAEKTDGDKNPDKTDDSKPKSPLVADTEFGKVSNMQAHKFARKP